MQADMHTSQVHNCFVIERFLVVISLQYMYMYVLHLHIYMCRLGYFHQ